MKNYAFYVGIDISKSWFDYSLRTMNNEVISSHRHKNNPNGISKMVKEVKRTCKVPVSEVLFCMEHTGIYGDPMKTAAEKLGLDLWVEAGWKIGKALGITRSKTDRVDARRIGEYAFRFRDKVIEWVGEPADLKRLRNLMAVRDRIIKAANLFSVPVNELRAMKMNKEAAEAEKLSKQALKALKAQLKEVDKNIDALILASEEYQKNYMLATSIPGVGRMTALWLILYTRNFTLFDDPKKLSCYAGCAPFEYTSGSSTRGKAKVSHYANKILKAALHMAALSAIRTNLDLKAYYLRKKKEQGKHSMLVLNAVRNKLIHTVMAVINRQTPWVAKFSKAEENLAGNN